MNFYDMMTLLWVSIAAIPVIAVGYKFYVDVIKGQS